MTYSIVGVDVASGQVGGAGTSCLMGEDVYVIYQAAPDHGVVHAQAYYSNAGRRRAAQLLAEGTAPTDIIAQVTMPSFDAQASLRQYGIVDLQGRTAAFTGADTMPFADSRQGSADGFAFSVQGNILTSQRVLDQAASAFADGCDLPERLMSALEAGADNHEGDKRCTAQGIPSDSAFLQVEAPGMATGEFLALRVKSSGNDSPLPLLREQLDAWRMQHPCPVPPAEPKSEYGNFTCDCRVPGHPGGSPSGLDAGFLLGCLLVVARRRQRAARQLRPVQAAR
jgi:uncharacterized Ntn-hydrolase superfamily protein